MRDGLKTKTAKETCNDVSIPIYDDIIDNFCNDVKDVMIWPILNSIDIYDEGEK